MRRLARVRLLIRRPQLRQFHFHRPRWDLVELHCAGSVRALRFRRAVRERGLSTFIGSTPGAVYTAERVDQHFRRRAAVKLIRWDADIPEVSGASTLSRIFLNIQGWV